MARRDDPKYRHFLLNGTAERQNYNSRPGRGGKSVLPDRNRKQHGGKLLRQLNYLEPQIAEARLRQKEAGVEEDGIGLQIEFEGFPDVQLAFESLADLRSRIELRNVRTDESSGVTLATVFVPDGKLPLFEKKIRDYITERKDKNGKARDNAPLISTIHQIRSATIAALWTDDPSFLPSTESESIWWEVWLAVGVNRERTIEEFRALAERQGFRVAKGELTFPERIVLLMYGSMGQMKKSVLVLNSVAELRLPKETAYFFDGLSPNEQRRWTEELAGRITVSAANSNVPHICLLDTGVNQGHPLLSPALSEADLHTIEPGWGTNDQDGHGTSTAGLALLGNLADVLDSSDPLPLSHRLESVKLLRMAGDNEGDARHHGYLTVEAVSRPAASYPFRNRLFSMAVTSRDGRDRGRPSAWSAAVDRIAADADNDGENPHLFIVSAGNVEDRQAWMEYPASNQSDSVHDPGQSWNALTVGASTHLDRITEEGTIAYRPVAGAGCLSPFSTTSLPWDRKNWPLKPDVVFEGGNVAQDGAGNAVTAASLSLLTTNFRTQESYFTTTNATSAASALAARMAAQLMAEYPSLWPETIRGLMVHSADWPDKMFDQFLPERWKSSKRDIANFIRTCGFGVPNLDRALWSVENSLTMIIEGSLQPFSESATMNEMNLHSLPWPHQDLEDLGSQEVKMRVTLSYFIEPNPGMRGYTNKYQYGSHGLRFDVRRPLETEAEFQRRISNTSDEEQDDSTEEPRTVKGPATDLNWVIGITNRHRGSIHSDIWQGSAAELAGLGMIAVYPTSGWWKTRTKLNRVDSRARYSLIVSIHAPDVETELYTAVKSQIPISIDT